MAGMTAPYRHYSGKIAYIDKSGQEWGRERFSGAVHAHGRTLRALCEMDEARLLREACWSVGTDWLPREGFVRNMRDGATIGSCWYRITGDVAECEGFTADHGRISRWLRAEQPIGHLGMHPLAGDAITAMVRGTDAPGVERVITCAANSLAHLGDEGLDLRQVAPVVAFVGPERITVGAGTFDALRYSIRWSDQVPHHTDFWIEPEDCLPLLAVLPGIGERYELVELDRPDPAMEPR
jgi:hypothetical protein